MLNHKNETKKNKEVRTFQKSTVLVVYSTYFEIYIIFFAAFAFIFIWLGNQIVTCRDSGIIFFSFVTLY